MNKQSQLSLSFPGALTMTSREIAGLTGKAISHVHRDVRSMLDDLADTNDPDLDHVREDKDRRGYVVCFHLPKSLTVTLMAGYNTKMRHAIVKRWQELEAQKVAPVSEDSPRTLSQALCVIQELKNQVKHLRTEFGLSALPAAPARLTIQEMVASAPETFRVSQRFSDVQAAQAARKAQALWVGA